MLTFHYIICDVPKKEKYHVKKLVFFDKKMEQSEDLMLTLNQLIKLKSGISEGEYTVINDSQVNLESFLKNINLIKP